MLPPAQCVVFLLFLGLFVFLVYPSALALTLGSGEKDFQDCSGHDFPTLEPLYLFNDVQRVIIAKESLILQFHPPPKVLFVYVCLSHKFIFCSSEI